MFSGKKSISCLPHTAFWELKSNPLEIETLAHYKYILLLQYHTECTLKYPNMTHLAEEYVYINIQISVFLFSALNLYRIA